MSCDVRVCEEQGEDDVSVADAGDAGCLHQVIRGCHVLLLRTM